MPSPHRILVVEDDAALRATLLEQLSADSDLVPDEADCAAEAQAKLAEDSARYHAILLDVGLPDADGRDFCIQLRRDGQHLPVIMLTGADTEQDVVRGLDAGANDYITKPFRPNELLARLRAQLRIFAESDAAVFTVGPYLFQPSAKRLMNPTNDRKTRLTDKENAILKYLYRAGARAVSHGELLTEVWGYSSEVTTHTLETHIYRLRQKIEPDPSCPRLLVTENRAYRLFPLAY